jgi:ATP-dependent RNA helicase RhlE
MHGSTSAAEEIRTNTFDDLPLADFLKETVKAIGYETPTPIQAEAIPLAVEGHDIIGLAQTGTGKTAAFVLPILQKISGSKEKGCKALILAPTRELAEQINDVIKQLAPRTGIKSVTIYGGMSHGRQISDLRAKPQIIVACPGRLLDHLGGRTVDLSGVETLVLDEADRMFDMGFLPEIKKIITKIPTERQTMLFSATMPPEIQELTRGIQNNPKIVRVKMEDAKSSVAHSLYQVAAKAKPQMLTYWLENNKGALVVVFTKMKHTAKRLAERLAKQGQHVTSLHGNLSQGKRQQSLNGFKDGRYRVLIATDIAARGIDVKGITHVINYDMPENLDAYIHRTGRAGRASSTGDAVSFVTRADASLLRSIERWLKSPVSRLETPDVSGIEVEVEETRERPQRGERRSARGESRGEPRGERGGRFSRGERSDRGPRRERPERAPRRSRDEGEFVEGAENATVEVMAEGSGEPRAERRERREGSPEGRRPRAEGRSEGRGDRRDARSDRAPRARSGDRFERGPRREPRGEGRPARSGRDFNRGSSEDRPQRQPHYAYGPESDNRRERPSFDRPQGDRPRFDRPQGERPRFDRNRDDRPSFNRDRGNARPERGNFRDDQPSRGQPRDRFEGLEGPDLSQTEALKVLDNRERAPRAGGRTGGGFRGGRAGGDRGGFGGRSNRTGGARPQRNSRGPSRSWDR